MEEKKIHPAIAEFAIEDRQELLAQLAEQAREIDEFSDLLERHGRLQVCASGVAKERDALRAELAALKQPISGAVVMPDRKAATVAWGYDMGGNYDEGYAEGFNDCLDEVARLNPSRGVPKGWKLVPVNIPCDMVSAFWKAIPVGKTSAIRVQDFWAAMLSAAPSHPDQCGVVVPRELLERLIEADEDFLHALHDICIKELRALLAGGAK